MNWRNNHLPVREYVPECLFLIIAALFVSSCSPVNYFTHLKTIPPEYQGNYTIGELKTGKLPSLYREPWTVFSDRDKNATFNYPGGRVKNKEIGFMESFFVIKERGNYLQVLNYSSTLTKDFRLADRKNAHYYGWIHKSKLLLGVNAMADIHTGLKSKFLTVLTDTTVMNHASGYLSIDSIYSYFDADLMHRKGSVPIHSIVYLLKKSTDGKSALISSVPEIQRDSAANQVIGWVSNRLLRSIGQQLHADLSPCSQTADALRYNPILSQQLCKDSILLKSYKSIPLVDQNANYVLNTKGKTIAYSRYKQLEKELKKINILFAFEGNKEMLPDFPAVVNVMQNLRQRLENKSDEFQYRIGFCTPLQKRGHEFKEGLSISLHSDISFVLDILSNVSMQIGTYRIREDRQWETLRQAVSMLDEYQQETNIIVYVGMTGYGGEEVPVALKNKVAENNCRLLAFQLYAGNRFTYDNFVLQMKNLIVDSARDIAENKQEYIAYTNLLREGNYYKQSRKNIYNLDFPEQSMSQGWLLFPEKGKKLTFDKLTFAADTLITQVENNNRELINGLDKAFSDNSDAKSVFHSLAANFLEVKPETFDKSLMKHFREIQPMLLIPEQFTYLKDSIPEYYLLLNGHELDKIRSFWETISSYEIDYYINDNTSSKKVSLKDVCNCSNEPAMSENSGLMFSDSIRNSIHYLSTRKIRKEIFNYFTEMVNEDKLCRKSFREVSRLSLAEVLHLVTGCPVNPSFLSAYTLGDLKKKKIITDGLLDYILQYFRSKKDVFDAKFQDGRFESNGLDYYWINSSLFP